MRQMTEMAAYAKINLFLEISGKRVDGYHMIDSYMQSVSLFDTVRVYTNESGIIINCSNASVPSDCRNIAYKAANSFYAATGLSGGCTVDIEKNIPVFAGLGGGSADAAAVLQALNRMYGYPLTNKSLLNLGATIGADVPFCLTGGLRRVSGIGDIVGESIGYRPFYVLILRPDDGISTAEAYAELDRLFAGFSSHSPATPDLVFDGERNEVSQIARGLFNRFECAVKVMCPETWDIIFLLRKKYGNALLSGSGSSVFSVFQKKEDAEEALDYIRSLKHLDFCGVFTSVDSGSSFTGIMEE